MPFLSFLCLTLSVQVIKIKFDSVHVIQIKFVFVSAGKKKISLILSVHVIKIKFDFVSASNNN